MARSLHTVSMMGRIIEVGSGEYWSVKSLEDCKAHGATHNYCNVCFDHGIITPAYAVIGATMKTVLCKLCLNKLGPIARSRS